MQELNWTAIITQAYWPFWGLLVALILRKPISTILRERKLTLSLPNNITATITTEDAGKTLTRLFTEFYFAYNRLMRPWHKELFDKILNSETKLYVNELIPGFDRNNEEHIGALRALRGLGLIEPKYGGSWDSKSIIEVTSFGQVFVKYLRMREKGAQKKIPADSQAPP
ncbi:MAG TPA: hypothetical protein ENK33_06510 [Desulfobacterales bacterium]|nr:hypothetical protein [Desulfobacterales bacterium]